MDCDPIYGEGQIRELESFAFENTFSNHPDDDFLVSSGFGIEGLDEPHLPFGNDVWDQSLLLSDSIGCNLNPIFEEHEDSSSIQLSQKLGDHYVSENQGVVFYQQPPPLAVTSIDHESTNSLLGVTNNGGHFALEGTQKSVKLGGSTSSKVKSISLLKINNPGKKTFGSKPAKTSPGIVEPDQFGPNACSMDAANSSRGVFIAPMSESHIMGDTVSRDNLGPDPLMETTSFHAQILDPIGNKVSIEVPVDQELDSLLDELNNVSEFFNHEQLNKANYFNDLCEATERVDYEENLFSQQDKGPEMQNIKYQIQSPKVEGALSNASNELSRTRAFLKQSTDTVVSGRTTLNVEISALNGEKSSGSIAQFKNDNGNSRRANQTGNISHPISPLEKIQLSDHNYCTLTKSTPSMECTSHMPIVTKSASDRPIVRSFSQCNKTKDIMQIGPGKHSIRYELLTTPTPPATLQRSVSGQPFSELSNTKGISELLSTCDVTVDSLNAEMTETYLKTRADFFRDTNQIASGASYHEFLEMTEDDHINDNETKKDSGVESGEVSDSGSDPLATGLYTKVPDYLTFVPVDVSGTAVSNDAAEKCYDRLPEYMKGISESPSSSITKDGELASELTSKPSSPGRPSISSLPVKKHGQSLLNHTTNMKKHRSSSSASNSSSSSYDKRARSPRKKPFQRRHTRHPSNSRSNTPSPSRERKYRSRSPLTPPRARTSRQDFVPKNKQQEREIEERRIIYVGKISEGTTRADLRERFEKFGPILEISLHFRDRGDNYGFVTFKYKSDAFRAIEKGNDNKAYEKVDLSFGGRRTFCKERYSDLDFAPASDVSNGLEDFDNLLKQARAGLKR